METYQQYKSQALSLFSDTIEYAGKLGKHEIADRLKAAAEHLREGKLFVVVGGEFKRGKSSLINMLLEDLTLCPTDVRVTTCMVSTISYGEQEKVTVCLDRKGVKEQVTIPREDLPTYVSEIAGKKTPAQTAPEVEVESVNIQLPNPKLKDGLVLVDTPGVGTMYANHTAATYAFIPYADAVIFVFSALNPLGDDELNFLKNKIAPHTRHIVFVMTLIDKVAGYQQVMEEQRQKIASTLDRAPGDITIVPVSNQLKCNALKNGNAEDMDDSNFVELENVLWSHLMQKQGIILLGRALDVLERSVTELLVPLSAELEAYQKRSESEIQALRDRYDAIRNQLVELDEGTAKWHQTLSQGISSLSRKMIAEVQTGFSSINQQANGYIAEDRFVEDPSQIASMVESDINDLFAKLNHQLSAEAGTLHQHLVQVTGLEQLRAQFRGALSISSSISSGNIAVEGVSAVDYVLTATRTALYTANSGAVAGAIAGGAIFAVVTLGAGTAAGAIIGGAIGYAIGAIKGFFMGSRQIREKQLADARRKLAMEIPPQIQRCQSLCQQKIGDNIDTVANVMRDDLMTQIKDARRMCEEAQENIKKAGRATQEEANKRIAELTVPIQQLTKAQQSATNMLVALADVAKASREDRAEDRAAAMA